MTVVEQAKHDRDNHWDTCQDGCVPPLLACEEGRRLHAVLCAVKYPWVPGF